MLQESGLARRVGDRDRYPPARWQLCEQRPGSGTATTSGPGDAEVVVAAPQPGWRSAPGIDADYLLHQLAGAVRRLVVLNQSWPSRLCGCQELGRGGALGEDDFGPRRCGAQLSRLAG